MQSVHSPWAENIHGSYFDGVVNYYLTQINRSRTGKINHENTKKSFAIKCILAWGRATLTH